MTLTLGRSSVHKVGRASAHEFPLKMAIDVATWMETDERRVTTSLSGEYAEAAREKLKATPGYDSTYIPRSCPFADGMNSPPYVGPKSRWYMCRNVGPADDSPGTGEPGADVPLACRTRSLSLKVMWFLVKSVTSIRRRRCSGPSKRSRMPFCGNPMQMGSVTGFLDEKMTSSFGKRWGSALSRVSTSWRLAPRTAGKCYQHMDTYIDVSDIVATYSGSPDHALAVAAQRRAT